MYEEVQGFVRLEMVICGQIMEPHWGTKTWLDGGKKKGTQTIAAEGKRQGDQQAANQGDEMRGAEQVVERGMNKKGSLCAMQLASVGLTYKGLPFYGGYSLTCDLEKNTHSKNP